jgi:ribosomal protein S18 acetylase RimI-like enzyme
MAADLIIRRAQLEDFPEIWSMLREVIKAGDSFAYDPETTYEEGLDIWVKTPVATYVALRGGVVVGSYVLRRNQPGRGSHVANAGYMVSSAARGGGVGRAMCLHSLAEARAMGFRTMQFNLVVSTNTRAIALWESCGFRRICELPDAFLHKELGYVPALVMHRLL